MPFLYALIAAVIIAVVVHLAGLALIWAVVIGVVVLVLLAAWGRRSAPL